MLLSHGANIEATNNDGWTPLNVAACNNFPAAVQCLLDNGADINAENEVRVEPLFVALSTSAAVCGVALW
jgi:ankyrin repeat protein